MRAETDSPPWESFDLVSCYPCGGLRLILPVLALGLVGTPTEVHSDVWRVPSPETFTLAVAIDAASPGDTIQVVGNGGATYFVNLTIDKDLTVQGGWRADFLMRDPEIYVSVLRDANGEFERPIIRVQGTQQLVIEGFKICGGRFGVLAQEGADMVIRDCVFREQENGTDLPPFGGKPGGAVRMVGGTLLMEGVDIRGIQTAFHGAAIGLESMKRAILRDCWIEDCVNFPILFGIFTPAFGGALYTADVGDLRLERTTIIRCASLSQGGLGYLERTSVTAVDCAFEQGAGSLNGGAFVLVESPAVSFTRTRFSLDRANEGGALYINRAGSLTLDTCSFEFNRAQVEGGAIWLASTPFTIRDCTFEQNNGIVAEVSDRGGAVRLTNSGGTVTNTSFRRERATGRGGAWSQVGGVTVFDGCVFEGNQSSLYGGALHIELAGSLDVQNSLLVDNVGKLGGAVGASFTGRVDVKRSTFTGNVGRTSGAAIYLDTGAVGAVENSILCCSPRGDLISCSASRVSVRFSNLWNDDAVNVRQELGGGCDDSLGTCADPSPDGNISEDPAFCDPLGPDFELSGGSCCVGTASDGGNMGWAATGCPGTRPLSVRKESWGAVKSRYRSILGSGSSR